MLSSIRIILIILIIFTFGLFAGCSKQDKAAESGSEVEEQEFEVELPMPEASVAEPAEEKTAPAEVSDEAAPKTEVADGIQYIGGRKCRKCHLKQYKSWDKTRMAKSYDNLKPGINTDAKIKAGLDPNKDYTTDPDCLRCHTTGYGKPGGFVSIEETPKLVNVQCESCHGPGSKYVKIMKKNKKFKRENAVAVGFMIPLRTTDERECMVCHGPDNPFDEEIDSKYSFELNFRFKKTHKHYPLKHKH